MNRDNWQHIIDITSDLLELPKDQREETLQKICKGNKKLQKSVREHLESIAESEQFWEEGLALNQEIFIDQQKTNGIGSYSNTDTLLGSKLGAYTIKERVASGGMGNVYLAKRSDGRFDRKVAIKVMAMNIHFEEVKRRFIREQQILGKLTHPSIAQLYDAGVTESGHPYLVMEYVEGEDLISYAKNNDLTLSQKLELFIRLCEAVEFAHQNLVVHRDLKPGNIFVKDDGTLKVLDFGISKLISESEKGADSDFTTQNLRLYTLNYAAPEQINQANITTVTDVYALGLLLYELLTSEKAFDISDKNRKESEAFLLNTEIHSGNKSDYEKYPTELDHILAKATRKEPQERYASARELKEDLLRFQNNKPIQAVKGTLSYKTQKFINRHKKSLAVTTITLLGVIGLVAFYTIQLSNERRIALNEQQKATEVKDLLIDIFESNDPLSGSEEQLSVKNLLDNGTAEVLSKDVAPSAKAELLTVLSTVFRNIVEYQRAMEVARSAFAVNSANFGEKSPEAAQSLLEIGRVHFELADYDSAAFYFKKAEAASQEVLSEDKLLWAEIYNELGRAEEEFSNYSSSKEYFSESLQILENQPQPNHEMYVDVLRNYARLHYRLNELEEADSLYHLVLQTSKDFYGDQHIVTASVMHDVGMFYMTQGRYDESRDFYQQSLQQKTEIYQDKLHPNISATISTLAIVEDYTSNFDLADSLYRKAIEMDTQIFDSLHAYIAINKGRLSEMYFRMGRFEEALKLEKEVLKIELATYDKEHRRVGSSYFRLGKLYTELGEYDTADEYFNQAKQIFQNQYEPTGRVFAEYYAARGENSYQKGEYDLSIDYLESATKAYQTLNPQWYIYRETISIIKKGRSLLASGNTDIGLEILQDIKMKMDTTEVLSRDNVPGIYRIYEEALEARP